MIVGTECYYCDISPCNLVLYDTFQGTNRTGVSFIFFYFFLFFFIEQSHQGIPWSSSDKQVHSNMIYDVV